jgi:metal-responsive CopG/Arc/MetJ family transcriptional regulator
MPKEKIAITLEEWSVEELDRLVDNKVFQNRSQAIQEAVNEKLSRIQKTRLVKECCKLDSGFERTISEEGFAEDTKQWPGY